MTILPSKECRICFNATDADLCWVCMSPLRSDAMIVVVETSTDVEEIEAREPSYLGQYHVAGPAIDSKSPNAARHPRPDAAPAPDEARVAALLARVRAGKCREVVIATRLDPAGESLAQQLALALLPMQPGVKVSRMWPAKITDLPPGTVQIPDHPPVE